MESFNATLEEAALSDFAHPRPRRLPAPRVLEFYDTTMKVLGELGADTKQMLVVFNKIDKIDDPATRAVLRRQFSRGRLSFPSTPGEGLDLLVERICRISSTKTA